jgi:hypothetical protein
MILSEKYFSFHVWLGKLCKEWSKNPRITALAIRCKIEADNGELRPRVFIISPEKDPEEVPSLPTSPSPYKRWPVWFALHKMACLVFLFRRPVQAGSIRK